MGDYYIIFTVYNPYLYNSMTVYNCIFFRYFKYLQKSKFESLCLLSMRRIAFV